VESAIALESTFVDRLAGLDVLVIEEVGTMY
jgi:hypothetical protein